MVFLGIVQREISGPTSKSPAGHLLDAEADLLGRLVLAAKGAGLTKDIRP